MYISLVAGVKVDKVVLKLGLILNFHKIHLFNYKYYFCIFFLHEFKF